MSDSICARSLLRLRDLPGQVANLPPNVALLIRVNGAELVELANLGIDFDFLHDSRISRCNRLDLRIGERAAFEVLGRTDRRLAPHHLMDEAGLCLQRLPLDRPIFRHFSTVVS